LHAKHRKYDQAKREINMICQIEVSLKKEFRDKHGEHVKHEMEELGVKGLASVRYCPVYVLEGEISDYQAERIAARLLIDPITEEFVINPADKKAGAVLASVWFKKGVTDTVSESLIKALKDISVKEKLSVKTGHRFYFMGKPTVDSLKQAAKKVLYNPMIQECRVQG